jgi:homoserine dehydrogenase
MDLRVALLGCGNVGRAFIAMVAEKEDELEARYGLRLLITGGLTRAGGGWIAPAGLPCRAVAESGWPRGGPPATAMPFVGDGVAFAAACPADVLVEITTLDPLTGEPAASHVRAALAAGRHVVTANKGPIAHAYRALRALADAHGVALRFEPTVMDGTPIFNLADYALPATRVAAFRGVLNSTSNAVLGAMAAGSSLEHAVARMQALGVAEANPAYDLEGWDAAVKATVLANVLLGADLRPAQVRRDGLGADAMRAAHATLPAGHTLKQLVEAARAADGAIAATVRLAALPPSDPFAHLAGMEAALTLQTDTLGDLTLIEGEGGPGQTAFGLLADIVAIARGLAATPGPSDGAGDHAPLDD